MVILSHSKEAENLLVAQSLKLVASAVRKDDNPMADQSTKAEYLSTPNLVQKIWKISRELLCCGSSFCSVSQ